MLGVLSTNNAQKMKFFIVDLDLLKKSLMENFIFCRTSLLKNVDKALNIAYFRGNLRQITSKCDNKLSGYFPYRMERHIKWPSSNTKEPHHQKHSNTFALITSYVLISLRREFSATKHFGKIYCIKSHFTCQFPKKQLKDLAVYDWKKNTPLLDLVNQKWPLYKIEVAFSVNVWQKLFIALHCNCRHLSNF